MTLTGRIQCEADYRRAHETGRGRVASTGVGAGNQYVLTGVSGGAGARADETARTTGTTTRAASRATAYELTGPNEGQANEFVGPARRGGRHGRGR